MNNAANLDPASRFSQAKEPDFLNLRIERYYQERVIKVWGGGHILRGRKPGPDALHLSSNDYLSVAKHPKILDAMAQELQRSGNGLLMSAIFVHAESPLRQFEERLAHFMHAESGVICQSGWCANTGLIQTIADERTPVYIDMLAHASLWEGIRIAGAKAIAVLHNEPEHLKKQIQLHGPGIVLVDSVYSTNGSVAPLREIADICTELGCLLVVDESHSLGTHGPEGAGLVVELGLTDRVHFRTASLAKAFAGRAGFVTCSKRFNEYFKSESNPAIFSSTLLPHEVAGLEATLAVIRHEDWRRKQLRVNAGYLRAGLEELGYNLSDSKSQILSLEAGMEQQAIILRDALEARGVFGSIFCPPATPKNHSLMRFSVNATLSYDELDRVLQVCRDIRDEVGLASWPSSRRSKRRTADSMQRLEAIGNRRAAGAAALGR